MRGHIHFFLWLFLPFPPPFSSSSSSQRDPYYLKPWLQKLHEALPLSEASRHSWSGLVTVPLICRAAKLRPREE